MANIFDAQPRTRTPEEKGEFVLFEELDAVREQAALYLVYRDTAERLADALYNLRPDHPLLKDEVWSERREQRWESDPDESGTSPDPIDPEFTAEEAAAHVAQKDAEAGGQREMDDDDDHIFTDADGNDR